ncbi:hypothetical protein E2562_009378 [Oryza meyeriana var. granulata]|uniref:Uncharacterized protein n=1 Tax=Oryza meyeriana var. granulata TaxID=110450 RepID=A0A6G1CGN9_9ORYZ|nr:hypothetical protein E2562_009378 [Oryza meyeriana var. granulata]
MQHLTRLPRHGRRRPGHLRRFGSSNSKQVTISGAATKCRNFLRNLVTLGHLLLPVEQRISRGTNSKAIPPVFTRRPCTSAHVQTNTGVMKLQSPSSGASCKLEEIVDTDIPLMMTPLTVVANLESMSVEQRRSGHVGALATKPCESNHVLGGWARSRKKRVGIHTRRRHRAYRGNRCRPHFSDSLV